MISLLNAKWIWFFRTAIMMMASLELVWADAKGWLTNGVPWSKIAKDKVAAIWDSIQLNISAYITKVSKTISNENQEFMFEPLI